MQYPIDIPHGMQLLPRSDGAPDVALHIENDQRSIILYTLASGSLGVPLSEAKKGARIEIVDGSNPFSDGTVQKYTVCINVCIFQLLMLFLQN